MTYMVGLDAARFPEALLSGDYDLGGLTPGMQCLWVQSPVTSPLHRHVARNAGYFWTNRLHKKGEGNILQADGSILSGKTKILIPIVEHNDGNSGYSFHILSPRIPEAE
jgi:hypothetical protein